MSLIADPLFPISEDTHSVSDPLITVPLSVLSTLQMEAKLYGEQSDAYIKIRNRLVKEIEDLRLQLRSIKSKPILTSDFLPGYFYKNHWDEVFLIYEVGNMGIFAKKVTSENAYCCFNVDGHKQNSSDERQNLILKMCDMWGVFLNEKSENI